MPGRGQPWKIGGLRDGSVTEADIDPAYQAIIEGGGGTGFQYATFTSIGTSGLRTGAFFGGDTTTFTGETGDSNSPMMRAGKVTKIWVRVLSGGAGATLTFRKNGSQDGTAVTFSSADNGTVVKQTEDHTFVIDDNIGWQLIGASVSISVTVEFDFS